MKCIKCGSGRLIHRHHVTYEPEQIVELCKRCHRIVTNLNTLVARHYNEKKKLTNEQRIKVHEFFMDGEIWILKSIVAPRLLLLEDKKKKRQERKMLKDKSKKNKKKRKNKMPKIKGIVNGPKAHFE